MIVQASMEVGGPRPAVVSALERHLRLGVLDDAASAAVSDHEPVLLRAGVAGVTKQVAVQALERVVRADRVVIPVRWVATGASGELFPTLDANIEIFEGHAGHTRLAMIGSYQPPFGRAGAAVDRLLLRRLAQSTLTSFLREVARLVDTGCASDCSGSHFGADRASSEQGTRAG